MKLLVLASVLLFSLNLFATAEEVSTEGQELHLTCTMNFTPFYIEIDQTHTKASLYSNNQPREFVTSMKIFAQLETAESKVLVFKPLSRMKDLKAFNVSIPKTMSFYLGKGNQPARVDLFNGNNLPGSCYVQFTPMTPQW